MKAYLLHDTEPGGKLYLAFGADAVSAAEALIRVIGGSPDVNRFSVGGSWEPADGTHIVVSDWWPYFTAHPDRPSAIDIVRGMR